MAISKTDFSTIMVIFFWKIKSSNWNFIRALWEKQICHVGHKQDAYLY